MGERHGKSQFSSRALFAVTLAVAALLGAYKIVDEFPRRVIVGAVAGVIVAVLITVYFEERDRVNR